jgi:hypothetical protein
MIEINVILSLFFFCLLSFFDFIVFNEEILLALCFLSFLFYCFNTLSDSVFNSFEDRASKFESDLLISYSSQKNMLINNFQNFFMLRGFSSKFKILLTTVAFYFKQVSSYAIHKSSSSIFAFSSSKLTELALTDQKLITTFQKNCIITLLYPLILNTTKTNSIRLVSSLISSKLKSQRKAKTSFLKFLSS